jgi:uncharacterized protein YukE
MTGAMGSRLSPAAEVRSTVGAMQVTPANVLHIRNALLAESQLLHDKVMTAQRQVHVGEPGRDDVSGQASEGFNPKIRGLIDQCAAYVDALAEAANNLGQTAKSYGHTEQQISESFVRFQTDNPAPTSVPSSPTASGPPLMSFARSLTSSTPSKAVQTPGDPRTLFPEASGEHS